MSKAEFARSVGVDPSYIGKILNGRYKGVISDKVLRLIAAVHNVSLEWLQSGQGGMVNSLKMVPQKTYDDLILCILSKLEGMDDDMKRDILRYIQERELLKELIEKREGKG